MTKIIVAFPTLGKTTYAKNHDDALDMESSRYLFKRDGYEHLTDEEFKGVENRERNPDGFDNYSDAILEEYSSNKWKYIFTSMHPELIRELLRKQPDLQLTFIYFNPTTESYEEVKRRMLSRGNRTELFDKVKNLIKQPDLLNIYSSDERKNMVMVHVPETYYLSDIL